MKRITNSIGMELVLIPAGTFTMGSPAEDEGGRTDERPQHEVEITRPFYLGVHEVTQEQYEKVMGKNPSAFSVGGKHSDRAKGMVTKQFPVENVSWAEAVEFCKKLSHLPEESKAKRVYRLPSEAEWEYSCRGGSDSRDSYYFGATLTSKQANFNYTPGRTTKVGSYQPNAFDLHDMHGNVYEWCSDWYASDYYTNSPRRDPLGPEMGSDRVIRGGSWINFDQSCRSASRYAFAPGFRSDYLGFRVALVPSVN